MGHHDIAAVAMFNKILLIVDIFLFTPESKV